VQHAIQVPPHCGRPWALVNPHGGAWTARRSKLPTLNPRGGRTQRELAARLQREAARAAARAGEEAAAAAARADAAQRALEAAEARSSALQAQLAARPTAEQARAVLPACA